MNLDDHETKIKDIMNAAQIHLVVATLLVTVTFAAGFTLPGGFESDHDSPNKGMAILTRKSAFSAFIVTDAIAFVCSAGAVFSYFVMAANHRPTTKNELRVLVNIYRVATILQFLSMSAVVVAFITGLESKHRTLNKIITLDNRLKNGGSNHLAHFVSNRRDDGGGGFESDTDSPNKGMAILLRRTAFRAFVVSDAIAFTCSAAAVFTYFAMAANAISAVTDLIIIIQLYRIATILQLLSMSAVVSAFATGMYVTLAHSPGLAVAACVIACISFVMFCSVMILLPGST
ncbi:hypothetical protein HAX54_040668 [Datura stramonium]|uniref:PGG domain-containing protein n=1 Tax=Datura stramonium TaxID=4076 RepID=A0ABS8SK80_DATST|nr:hypothetical protein [Datura stramonium]